MKRKFFSLILFNVTLFFALISIHELGHATFSFLTDCKEGKVIMFDLNGNAPYTLLSCSDLKSKWLISLGGFFSTLLFGCLFLFSGKSDKNVFWLILGFSIVFSSFDIVSILNIPFLFPTLIGVGFTFVSVGEYLIASYLIETKKTYLLIRE